MNESQERVNWVHRRADCSPAILFENLLKVINEDIHVMNQLPVATRRGCEFKCVPTEGMYKVSRTGAGPAQSDHLYLGLWENQVQFRRKDMSEPLEIKHKWDDENNDCCLCINGQRMELWEVSKAILNPLFFDW